MTNAEFITAVERSFSEFVDSGTSRSTRKLVPLHGAIAKDMHERLGVGFGIQSQGFGLGREGTIEGRYMDKKVDITITRDDRPVGGIAVKFVIRHPPLAEKSQNLKIRVPWQSHIAVRSDFPHRHTT